MFEYKIKIYEDRTEWYNLKGQLHREGGPAIEYANGTKSWYLNGKEYTETEFNKKTGKGCPETITINGTKYQKIK